MTFVETCNDIFERTVALYHVTDILLGLVHSHSPSLKKWSIGLLKTMDLMAYQVLFL